MPLGAGRVALVVGDAVGHGVPAAGADEPAPGRDAVDAPCATRRPGRSWGRSTTFAAQMDDVEGASVFYGVLDAGTGRLTYGAAGHPPPLVVQRRRHDVVPAVTPATAAGQPARTSTTEVSEHVLEQGATLVLFSNGADRGGDARSPTRRWTGWPT